MATNLAAIVHVAGPPEKTNADTAAGWRWTQRCLRCDREVFVAVWWELGANVYELPDGRMVAAVPTLSPDAYGRCWPADEDDE